MKKIYALALVAAVSVSAYAKVDLSTSKVTTMSQDELNVTSQVVVAGSDLQKTQVKEPLAQDMVKDTYLYHAYNRASGDSGGEHDQVLAIVFDGAQDGDSHGENCTVYGIFYDYPLRAVYNASAGTLRFYEQPIAMNTYYNEMMTLYTQDAQTEADIAYIELEYKPNGVELTYTATGEKFMVAVNGFFAPLMNEFVVTIPSLHGTNSGWMWKYQNWFNTVEFLYPEAAVNTDDSDWVSVGNASITDGWMKPTCNNGQSLGAYNVPCKQNKTNTNRFLLENPYGTGTPYAAYNTLNTPGSIILEVITEEVENEDGDMVDMSTVAVYPFVSSGYANSEVGVVGPVYATNLEGKYWFMLGSTIEDMYYDFADMDYQMSSVSADGKTLTLPNCRVQTVGEDAVVTDQWYNSESKPIPMESTIVLPVAAGAGVNGIVDDAANGVKRYFNLQGVEIANPAAGELVIVKEGNKASKVIVK